MSNKSGRGYLLDFIPNATLLRAVTYARRLIDGGTPPEAANSRAAAYYRVAVTDVANYTARAHMRRK